MEDFARQPLRPDWALVERLRELAVGAMRTAHFRRDVLAGVRDGVAEQLCVGSEIIGEESE